MKKATKYLSIISLSGGLIYLLHTKLVKKDFNKIKSSAEESRKLINRLIEQVKNSKHSLTNLKGSLKNINFEQLNNHVNHFNHNLKPHLKKMQRDIKSIKSSRN